jgi:hypothetical protein
MNLPRFSDHPVTWDEIGNRIDGDSVCNSSKGFRPSDIGCYVLVAYNPPFAPSIRSLESLSPEDANEKDVTRWRDQC